MNAPVGTDAATQRPAWEVAEVIRLHGEEFLAKHGLTAEQRRVLFDLAADKSETTDLAARRPAVVEELLRQLSQWESGLQNPMWPRVMDYHYRDRDGVYYFPL